MFLKELLAKDRHEYVCRELTLLWKDAETDEYKFYTSVILETYGWNRFDYSAFNHGQLPPPQHEMDVIVYTSQMKEKKTYTRHNTFLLDYSIWYPEYNKRKTKFRHVF
jgi:hypothetical protein